ncbi:MAG: hypothetical protein M4D80_28380 [Myxococcota bacterium]|nr:hypothetical protein [Myxococcota bacterium]
MKRLALALVLIGGIVGCFGSGGGNSPDGGVDAPDAGNGTGSGSASAMAGTTGADDGVAMLGLAAGFLVCGLRLRLRFRRRVRVVAPGQIQSDPAWALLAATQAGVIEAGGRESSTHAD